MKKKITSLAELEKEQKKLKMLMDMTKTEFLRSMHENRQQAKDYLVKKVMLPVGAVGLGVVTARNMANNSDEPQTDTDTEASTNKDDKLRQLVALGVEILQVYFMQQQQKEISEIKETQEENTL